VLIAEDNVDSAESQAHLVRLFGHRVEVAFDGQTALELADATHPEVLLLDIGLPGLSGYEVAAQLKDRHGQKKPSIIAVTGYGREEDRRLATEAGIHLHLLKPVDPEMLRAILQRFQAVIAEAGSR